MNLRRLSHVVALAEEQHFARAAARVHLTQPAFSRSIQAIEEELGLRLFDRETGEVRATPAGAFVIERARRLLFDARCLQRDVDLYRDSQIGDIAFGVGPVVAMELMPRVLSELRAAYPSVTFRFEQHNSRQLMEQLLAESIEFCVADIRDLEHESLVDIQKLPNQPIQCFVRARHPLIGKHCALAEVWSFGVASVNLSDASSRKIAEVLQLAKHKEPALAVKSNNFSVLASLVQSTDTILISTPAAVRAELKAGLLAPLRIADMPLIRTHFGIVTLHNRTSSPIAQKAMACIQRVAQDLDARQ